MNSVNCVTYYSDLLARHQYAIVDRAALPESTLKRFPLSLLVHRELENDEGMLPGLLPLEKDAPYMKLLAACMVLGQKDPSLNPVGTLIVASPDIEPRRLETHLTSRLIVYSQQGRAFLRYYSSDIFPHLVRILAPARLKSLFGPQGQVYQWTYRFQNEWITVPVPDVTEGVPLTWIIRREEHESLDLVGEVNQALDTYCDNMGRPWNNHAEWNEKACLVERSMGVAKRTYHLSASMDLVAFAVQALTHGERFYDHPRIHNLLQETASRPCAYRDATIAITDEEWAAMDVEHSFQNNF